MRIALVGKGGSGKTTVSALLIRHLAASGVPVVAVDADINQHLAASLGLDEAAASGVVLLHENEKGIYGDTPERVLDIMETVDSPALRVAWDSANFVQVGVKPYTEAYAVLRPYLEYFQIKDAVAGTGQVVPAGEGDGELDATIAALKADGFAGFASLEPHLASTHELGGFSGPVAFGAAARAFAALAAKNGVALA